MPRAPIRLDHSEPQAGLVSRWTIGKVERALDRLEQGEFLDAALLAEAMGRDDRITSCWTTLYQTVLGLPFEMQPSADGDQRKAKAVAKDFGGKWFDCFPEDVETEVLFWRVFLGFCVCQVVVDTKADWRHRLEVWNPQYLSYDSTTRQLVANTTTGQVPVVHGDGQWVVFGGRARRPWRQGAIRSLAVPWLVRQFAWRDWARYSERHGSPILKIMFPASSGGQAVGGGVSGSNENEWYARVQSLGRNAFAYLPQGVGAEGENFDLQLLESKANTHEGFEKLIVRADTSIAVRLLGQNLTTEVQGGSYAAATAHGRVFQGYLAGIVEGEATDARSGVCQPWAQRVYGSVDLGPWPRRCADPPEDKAARAKAGEALGKALSSFDTAGFEVENAEELAEQYGFELKKREPSELGLPARIPGAPPANDDQEAEDVAAAARRPGRVLAKAAPKDEDENDDQEYADRLATSMQRHGARTLAPTIASMLAAVAKAESYDEAREEIFKRYGKLKSPTELAELTEAALVMSQLGGHVGVNEDTEAAE
jgi:phage gp29-like protein